MLITKEEQEEWLASYMNESKTSDECLGFIDGISKTLNAVNDILLIRKEKQRNEDLEMRHTNIIESGSLSECQNHVEGIINDFEDGICGKEETISAMGEYTMRLMEIFWKSAKVKIKANTDIL
jgi:hypothetical protein